MAIVGLIGIAVSYLVLRAKNIDLYSGLDLASDNGWQRIEKAIEQANHEPETIPQFMLRVGYVDKYPNPVTVRRSVNWFAHA